MAAVTPGNIYNLAMIALPASDIDHHSSDLYIKVSPASKELIKQLTPNVLLSVFRSPLDGCMWYDLPFCYLPFWENPRGVIEEG